MKLPGNDISTLMWVSVEAIADMSPEAQNKIKKNCVKEKVKTAKNRYLIPLTQEDRCLSFNDQGYSVLFNPDKDNNFQFSALAYSLLSYDVFRSA